ncbi:MAG TPA: class F sortase, partial [Candidatus Saccharimonadales bacterium]|nr:class F sortase [Candidatus Saccharimonadales bacterium]
IRIGAEVVVMLADGTNIQFTISDMKTWPATSHPIGLFNVDGPPTLSLITCAGSYDPTTETYADRLVVDASFVAPT